MPEQSDSAPLYLLLLLLLLLLMLLRCHDSVSNDRQHNDTELNNIQQYIMLSFGFFYCDDVCRYAECHYAECNYAVCHYAECHYAGYCAYLCRHFAGS
jgi:hypothetical protein